MTTARESGATSEFAALVETLNTRLVEPIRSAEQAAIKGVLGQMPAQEVILKVMEAERTLHTAIAIRDKAIGVYQEISRMTI